LPANSECVLRPVPVAVPPSGICATRGRRVPRPGAAEPDLRGVARELLAQRHGTASMRWVRPAFRCPRTHRPWPRTPPRGARAPGAAGSSPRRARRGGLRSGTRRWTDCPRFTWSFGCTALAGQARETSFGVHVRRRARARLEDIDGNCSSWRPSAISSAAAAIRSARGRSRAVPSSAFARAAAPLIRPEPAHDRHGHGLARDGEVRHRLRGLAAPQLLAGPARSSAASRSGSGGEDASARRARGVRRLGRDVARIELPVAVRAGQHRIGEMAAGWRRTTGGPSSERCSSPHA
jgi:hypothetical protein